MLVGGSTNITFIDRSRIDYVQHIRASDEVSRNNYLHMRKLENPIPELGRDVVIIGLPVGEIVQTDLPEGARNMADMFNAARSHPVTHTKALEFSPKIE